MAIFIKGDLWDELGKADIILVTTNTYVKENGELVMGRGAAKEALIRFPKLSEDFGSQIIKAVREYPYKYGVIIASSNVNIIYPNTLVGGFQVKEHWKSQARLDLIEFSTNHLKWLISKLQWKQVAINFPGIGNGKLKREEVLPIISKLPDNVFIYEKEGDK